MGQMNLKLMKFLKWLRVQHSQEKPFLSKEELRAKDLAEH